MALEPVSNNDHLVRKNCGDEEKEGEMERGSEGERERGREGETPRQKPCRNTIQTISNFTLMATLNFDPPNEGTSTQTMTACL